MYTHRRNCLANFPGRHLARRPSPRNFLVVSCIVRSRCTAFFFSQEKRPFVLLIRAVSIRQAAGLQPACTLRYSTHADSEAPTADACVVKSSDQRYRATHTEEEQLSTSRWWVRESLRHASRHGLSLSLFLACDVCTYVRTHFGHFHSSSDMFPIIVLYYLHTSLRSPCLIRSSVFICLYSTSTISVTACYHLRMLPCTRCPWQIAFTASE